MWKTDRKGGKYVWTSPFLSVCCLFDLNYLKCPSLSLPPPPPLPSYIYAGGVKGGNMWWIKMLNIDQPATTKPQTAVFAGCFKPIPNELGISIFQQDVWWLGGNLFVIVFQVRPTCCLALKRSLKHPWDKCWTDRLNANHYISILTSYLPSYRMAKCSIICPLLCCSSTTF